MKRSTTLFLSLFLLVTFFVSAKQKPKTPPAAAARPEPAMARAEPPGRPAESEPKPYEKVITPEFKTQTGLFKVHTLKSKVFFEIPKTELDKDQLLVVQIKKSPQEVSYPGQEVDDLVVRWQLRENKLLLSVISYANIADPSNPISRAVEAMNTPTIMMAFPVETFAKDGAPVVDPTKFFTSDVNEIPVKKIVQGTSLDASRSFLDKVRVFPINLNVEATQTFNPQPPQLPPGLPPQYAAFMPQPPSRTAVVHYSFVKLPDKPMMGRLADERVGYFTHNHADYGRPDHEVSVRRFIARWRLEKKDPAAAKSEPVKPITFYVDPATPKQWVPFIKKAIEAWQPAFEEAGFLKAIVAKEAPSAQEDPDWSADDARYSVIRWIPSTTANAMGPHVSDPRSGEILEADIEIYHNILQLQTDWYFAQVGPLDPRCQTLPLPDELMGQLLQFVVIHEIGHSLGLPHNFKASATYPLEKIRDKNWVKKMGHVPTLMDYCRFNYVAQPEDGIALEDLIPKIGPYDIFSIRWGYTPIADARTPDDEKKNLNEWCKVQETTPWLRFSTSGSQGTDPGEETEAVGDIDAVRATTLGTKNIRRALDLLPKATLKPGEDYQKLSHLYSAILDQWGRELGHVANIVAGYDSEPKVGTAPGVRFTPVSKAHQQEAVKFLNENLFKTPAWIVPADIVRKLEPGSGQTRAVALQRAVLNSLLRKNRVARLQDHEAILGIKAYTLAQLLADLQSGIFGELRSAGVRIDPFRRNLQRIYVDILGERLTPPAASSATLTSGNYDVVVGSDDTRGAVRAELKSLLALIKTQVAAAGDKATRTHLEDLKDLIGKLLDPRGLATGTLPGTSPTRIEE